MSQSPTSRTQNAGDITDQVRDLAQAGWGRNAIARELGVSNYQVDKAAQAAGVTFDRAKVAQAVQARVVDAQAEREELAAQFRSVARVILSKVLSSSPEELNPLEMKEWIWTAGAAASSDARYGKLNLDVLQSRNAQQTTDDLNTVVDALTTSITQITTIPDDELMDMLDGEV